VVDVKSVKKKRRAWIF